MTKLPLAYPRSTALAPPPPTHAASLIEVTQRNIFHLEVEELSWMRFSGSHIVPLTQRGGFGVHNSKRKRLKPDNDLEIACFLPYSCCERPKTPRQICKACGHSLDVSAFRGQAKVKPTPYCWYAVAVWCPRFCWDFFKRLFQMRSVTNFIAHIHC